MGKGSGRSGSATATIYAIAVSSRQERTTHGPRCLFQRGLSLGQIVVVRRLSETDR